ncbi:MAG: hypothetical protein QF637_04885, partial [Acidimicrobiales bacterium]|nr:hypothetical protein [Acidimicrobiales bacterium]
RSVRRLEKYQDCGVVSLPSPPLAAHGRYLQVFLVDVTFLLVDVTFHSDCSETFDVTTPHQTVGSTRLRHSWNQSAISATRS